MNNIMNIIIKNKKYRMISIKKSHYKNINSSSISFKVQVKILGFWITIKEFITGVYDNEEEFCKNEAIELYNKIVNPYGRI